MTTATNIYDFLEDFATANSLNFDYGSFEYLQQQLLISVRNGEPIAERYPKLMLILPAPYSGGANNNEAVEYTLHLVIIGLTPPQATNPERLTNSFKAELYPIFELLKTELKKYSLEEFDQLSYDYSDLFYYSATDSKEANKFAEYLNAIELTNLKFVINFDDYKVCTND